jgi:hypothetical protein
MNGNNRQRVELALNESATLKLLKDKCYEGSNNFEPYYMYTVEHQGDEKAFFATTEIHQKILESGLKTGDEFLVRKVPVQNGKKVSAKVAFVVVSKHNGQPTPSNGEMHYRETMETCLRDAVSATQAVNTVTWTTENITSIALTMFIQRTLHRRNSTTFRLGRILLS